MKKDFIIPAIDIMDGKAVRLTQGDYAQKKVYGEDPLTIAKNFEAAGIRRLHLVDLDGAKARKLVNMKVLQKIADHTGLVIDFGGGITNTAAVETVLSAGASLVTVGSIAITDPLLLRSWADRFGAERFFIGADVWREQVKIKGWLEDGGTDVFSFLSSMIEHGFKHFFCTDISKDGLLQGPSIELYRQLVQQFPLVELVASGGVQSIADLHLLEQAGCSGAIVGKAIYEGNISLNEITIFNR